MALFSLETLRAINIDEEFTSFDQGRNEDSYELLVSKIKQKWETYVDNLIKSKDPSIEVRFFTRLESTSQQAAFYHNDNLSKITKDDILCTLNFNVSFRNQKRSLFTLQGIPEASLPLIANITIASDGEFDEDTKAGIMSAITLFIE